MTNIILDTNVTRFLVGDVPLGAIDERTQHLIERFKALDYRLLLSPITLMEMECHIADPTEEGFMPCFKAIRNLMHMEEVFCKAPQGIPFIAPYDVMIAQELYGVLLTDKVDIYNNFIAVASDIAKLPSTCVPDTIKDFCAEVKKEVTGMELQFAGQIRGLENMTRAYKGIKGKKLSEWHGFEHVQVGLVMFFLSMVTNAIRTQNNLPTTMALLKEKGNSDAEVIQLAEEQSMISKRIIEEYSAPVTLLKEVYKKVHDDNYPDERIYNYLWDIMLLFHVHDKTFQGEKCLFITDDNAMKKAATDSGNGHNLMTWDDFKEIVINN